MAAVPVAPLIPAEPPRGERRRALRLAKRLCEVARVGDAKQMESLLDDGADPEMPGFGGNTALMVAAWNDRADCVALLIERGARVDHGDPDYGYTPLLLAAQYGALAAAKLLVAAGAGLACRLSGGPDEGMTARSVALRGTSRVYADPQPGRSGRQRIDSQHSAVAELLLNAERALVGACQRLAFATCLLEGHETQGLRSFETLPRNSAGGCDLIWCGMSDGEVADETERAHFEHSQQQLADDEDIDIHAAIVASLADQPGIIADHLAARCAWVHLHPPNCNCTEKRMQSLSAAASAPMSPEVKLATRIAELEAAQQGARTGRFDYRELRRLKEEAAPLKKALIAQQVTAYRQALAVEQEQLGRKEKLPISNSAGLSAKESFVSLSIVGCLQALIVPHNVLAATLAEEQTWGE